MYLSSLFHCTTHMHTVYSAFSLCSERAEDIVCGFSLQKKLVRQHIFGFSPLFYILIHKHRST